MYMQGAAVAQWVELRTSDRKVAGSNPWLPGTGIEHNTEPQIAPDARSAPSCHQ